MEDWTRITKNASIFSNICRWIMKAVLCESSLGSRPLNQIHCNKHIAKDGSVEKKNPQRQSLDWLIASFNDRWISEQSSHREGVGGGWGVSNFNQYINWTQPQPFNVLSMKTQTWIGVEFTLKMQGFFFKWRSHISCWREFSHLNLTTNTNLIWWYLEH